MKRWFVIVVVLLLVGLGSPGAAQRTSAINGLPYSASITGRVIDQATSRPLADATVMIAELALSTRSDAAGQFALIAPIAAPSYPVTITVSAPAYGVWSVHNVRLIAADTLQLEPALGAAPTRIVVPDPSSVERAADDAVAQPAAALAGSLVYPPATIRVRVTGSTTCSTNAPYTVVTLDFKDYVRHVLPHEWIASWNSESLKAGAMATKSYAWYWINRGGKWPDADVYDSTCDQVYVPGVTYASTNAAIEATWLAHMTRSNSIVHASYRAYWSQCQAANIVGSCMGQWESKYMADDGVQWGEILRYFYRNISLGYPNRVLVPLIINQGETSDALP